MLKLSEVTLAILTVPRTPAYIHKTLTSILSSGSEVYELGPLEVNVDSNDRTYLKEYKGCSKLEISYLSDGAAAEECQRPGAVRFCHNYHRCLLKPGNSGVLVLEDDVLVRDHFLLCLKQAVDEMEENGLSKYVLSLHSKANLPKHDSFHRGKFYISYFTEMFYGTQGMYYPASMVPEIRRVILQQGFHQREKPGDLLIKDLVGKQQNLYNTAWDIVEHIGEVSTGLGGAPRSQTFSEPWRALNRTLS